MTTPSAPDVFDSAAASYDRNFEALPGAPRLRGIIRSYLFDYIHPGERLLELNAGTGSDAVSCAARGIRVHATDGSPAMVEAIREKALSLPPGSVLSTAIMDLNNPLLPGGQTFDAILSNLGGLNCIRETAPLLSALTGMVRQGGHLLLCFMPRISLWESGAFLLRGNLAGARRRLHSEGCLATIPGGTVRTFYHDPRTIIDQARPAFVHVRSVGLNIFTPPPSSRKASRLLGPVLPILERLEDMVSALPPMNRLGDHVLLILRRV